MSFIKQKCMPVMIKLIMNRIKTLKTKQSIPEIMSEVYFDSTIHLSTNLRSLTHNDSINKKFKPSC